LRHKQRNVVERRVNKREYVFAGRPHSKNSLLGHRADPGLPKK
jgi:hypothetical protein